MSSARLLLPPREHVKSGMPAAVEMPAPTMKIPRLQLLMLAEAAASASSPLDVLSAAFGIVSFSCSREPPFNDELVICT